jgi:cytochrome c oxidase cbb3-type subunit 3
VSKQTPLNQVLGHADEADGIEEYDNPLPNWWLGLFYFTIVWAVLYTVHYHFVAERSHPKALAAEMAEADARWPRQAEAAQAATLVMSEEAIEAGEDVFKANCVSCHGADMKGGIGPNLLDTVWIHGGTPEAIVNTITKGVPEKGMLTWGPILGPEKIAEVAAYVVHKNREATGHDDDDDDDEDQHAAAPKAGGAS